MSLGLTTIRLVCRLLAGLSVVTLAMSVPTLASAATQTSSGNSHSGLLYIVDTLDGSNKSAILLVDPSQGKVMQSFQAGYRPDIILSPDGSRLYVASERVNPSTQLLEGILQTYDTSSGKVLSTAHNPDMLTSTVPVYKTRMAMSPSGRYIYMLKDHNTVETTDLYVTAFDTVGGRVLRDHVSIPECNAVLLPTSRDLDLYVGCIESAYVREVGLSDSDEPRMELMLPVKTFSLMNRWGAMMVLPKEKGILLVARDGSGFVLDPSSGNVQSLGKLLASGKLTGMHDILMSKSGSEAYFAAGEEERGFEWYDQVVKLDASDLTVKATESTGVPFFSLALSANGGTLYTLNPERATLTVIDSASLRELRRMTHIGQTPIFAVPVP
jgi:DNA-binding beta-propeller fold protein YncE